MFNKLKQLITNQQNVMETLQDDPFYFQPQAVGYHPNNAYTLGLISSLAYKNGSQLNPNLQKDVPRWISKFNVAALALDKTKPNWFDCDTWSLTDTQAIVLENQEVVIIGFRGSQEIIDWLTDSQIIQRTKGPGGYGVHFGIYYALMSIWDKIEPYIKNKGDKTLWFTGHSLGAGLAVMATAHCLFELNIIPNGLYNYGQPKVGSEDFVEAFNKKFVNQTFRFANNNDLVPFLPLSQSDLSVKVPNLVKYLPRTQKLNIVNAPTIIDYYHVGHLKYFDKDGVLHDEGLGIGDKWLDRIAGHLNSLLKIAPGSLTVGGLFDRADLLGDHMIKQYIVNLKKHREEWEMNKKSVSS
ncbi:lipase family protein [Brasilonema bromeliae]|uniref:Fungal lipase-type domain-containing protein n=1 Tax=Brasilonema bromeliae SPC951 TaxID=385972 RepID=A0ABX1P722_9CYAN|nr:lipase family protein [Brasilonema bromeliae]NMG19736.1 hypothetical protein [Brasilonema bromeliae SPC951]